MKPGNGPRLVLYPRITCQNARPDIKPFGSLREHFVDACFVSLNHKNSGLPALKQFVILDATLSMRLFPKTLNVARKKASYLVCSIFLFKGT